jgi:F-type H+-transporting ATPase subunit delta
MVTSTWPYSSALFEVAAEMQQEEAYLSYLKEIEAVIEENPDYKMALGHPLVDKEQKKNWMKELFAASYPEFLVNFLQILAQESLAGQIGAVRQEFEQMLREANNIEQVSVESAVELNEEQIARLVAMLEKKLSKKVELSVKVDPALIAGLRIHSGSYVLDNTIATRLNTMKEKLSN